MSQDAVVVIGAGAIGQVIARRQGAGKSILLGDFDEDRLRAAANALTVAGHRVTTQSVDVSSLESVSAVATAADELGSVVQVAHPAGLSPTMAPPAAVRAVDLYGVFPGMQGRSSHRVRGAHRDGRRFQRVRLTNR